MVVPDVEGLPLSQVSRLRLWLIFWCAQGSVDKQNHFWSHQKQTGSLLWLAGADLWRACWLIRIILCCCSHSSMPRSLPSCGLFDNWMMQSVSCLLYLMWRDKLQAGAWLYTAWGCGVESFQTISLPPPLALQMMVGWEGVESKQINKSSWEGSIRQMSEALEIIHQEPSNQWEGEKLVCEHAL